MENKDEMMVANITGGPSPSSSQVPPLQSPPSIAPPTLQPSPNECASTSSTSPTNTSASESSTVSPLDLAALLAAARPAQNMKPDFSALIKQDSQPMSNPPFGIPDPGALLNFLQQAQQQAAIMQAARTAAAAQEMRRQQEQRERQQQQQTEKKRSYPCTFQYCVICQKDVHSSKLPCHIRQCHVAKPMFQCPQCDFTSTYSKNNVKSHMVSLHGLAGDPISYMDRYAPQVEEFMKMCFPNVRGRGRPMQGRGSPRSPKAPTTPAARTNPTTPTSARRPSFSQEEIVQLQNQQRILLAQQNLLNPLALFQQGLFNNNNGLAALKSPLLGVKSEPPSEVMDVVASSASVVDSNIQTPRQNFKTISQPIRPGENWQPRYSTLAFSWSVLNEEQAQQTVFGHLKTVCAQSVELPASVKYRDITNSVLTTDEATTVKAVREKLGLKYHDILFAIDKTNFEFVGSTLNIDLLIAISPSPLDCAFLRQLSVTDLNDEENFLVELSQIPRLENKLSVMRHMSYFETELSAVQENLNALSDAAATLLSSCSFKELLQMILSMYQQVVPGADTVSGFVVSKMMDICSYKHPSGQQLLNYLAQTIRDRATEVNSVFNLISCLEKAANSSYSKQEMILSQLKDGNTRCEMELKASSENSILSEFLEQSQKELDSTTSQMNAVKVNLLSLLAYMAEPLPYPLQPFEPEHFFHRVHDFLVALKDLVEQIEV